MKTLFFFMIPAFALLKAPTFAQHKKLKSVTKDSIGNYVASADSTNKDSLTLNHHDPHKATMRALMLPGLGQIYNRQYWKLPLAYAAVAIPAGFFFYNNSWYKKTKLAYEIVQGQQTGRYKEIDKGLLARNPLTGARDTPLDAASYQFYRNSFRQNRDYSVLFFLLGYALTIVDATVSGHLKEFDISEDLSMNIQPAFDAFTKTPGIAMAVSFKNPGPRKLKSW